MIPQPAPPTRIDISTAVAIVAAAASNIDESTRYDVVAAQPPRVQNSIRDVIGNRLPWAMCAARIVGSTVLGAGLGQVASSLGESDSVAAVVMGAGVGMVAGFIAHSVAGPEILNDQSANEQAQP